MLTFVITSVTISYVPILTVVGIRRMPYRSGILSAQLIRREHRSVFRFFLRIAFQVLLGYKVHQSNEPMNS